MLFKTLILTNCELVASAIERAARPSVLRTFIPTLISLSIDKFSTNMEYEINSIAYLFKPINDNGELVIYHQGHSGGFIEGIDTIQFFLEKNYSVVSFSMPLFGMNSQPIIDSSEFGKIKLQSHNQLEFYNMKFDLRFLEKEGLKVNGQKLIDVIVLVR